MKKANIDINKFIQYLYPLLRKGRLFAQKAGVQLIYEAKTISAFLISHKETLLKASAPILIIGCGLYSCSLSQKKVIADIADIFELADGIRTYYVNKPDYWGLNTENGIKLNIFPQKFIKKNKLVLSSGMNILVGNGEQAEVIMPLQNSFDIVMSGLNKAQCLSYTEKELQENQLLTLYSISIINQTGRYTFEWGGNYSLPVKKSAAKDLCADRQNTIIWSMK